MFAAEELYRLILAILGVFNKKHEEKPCVQQ